MPLKLDYKDIGWWFWVTIAIALGVGLAGVKTAFLAAIALGAAQMVYFMVCEKSFTSFPVQVREGYLGLLIVAFFEPYNILYALMLLSTLMLIVTGNCVLAKILKKAPWNQEVETMPLSCELPQKVEEEETKKAA